MADEKRINIEEEDEEVILLLALLLSYDLRIFALRIEGLVTGLRQQGVRDERILEILTTDLRGNGRIFGELRNSIRRGIYYGITQLSQMGQAGVYGDSVSGEALYTWVNVEDGHKICDDCLNRAGAQDTWNNWIARGMPATGWSICGSACLCILDPVGNLDSTEVI